METQLRDFVAVTGKRVFQEGFSRDRKLWIPKKLTADNASKASIVIKYHMSPQFLKRYIYCLKIFFLSHKTALQCERGLIPEERITIRKLHKGK